MYVMYVMYVYVCMYMYVCICMYVYVCICMYMYVYVYVCTARLFSTHATPLQRYGTDMAQNGICKTPASVVNRAAQGQMQSKKRQIPHPLLKRSAPRVRASHSVGF